jgi:hypothetical protein
MAIEHSTVFRSRGAVSTAIAAGQWQLNTSQSSAVAALSRPQSRRNFWRTFCGSSMGRATNGCRTWGWKSRIVLLGNVDIRAADVFWSFKDQILSKRPLPHLEQQIQAALLTGLMKYFAQLGLGEDVDADLREEKMNALKGRADWIKFTKPETPAKPTVTAVADPTSAAVAANVIYFDELTGIAQNAQVSFDPLKQKTPGEKAQSTTTTARKLPWREWNSGMGSVMGDAAADKAAAVAVLHSLHARFDVCKEQIDVWQVGSGKRVNATHDAEANEILLPPVVPRQSKVLERSEHPWAQHIEVRVRNCAEDDDGTLMRTATFYMNPEFTPPHAMGQMVPPNWYKWFNSCFQTCLWLGQSIPSKASQQKQHLKNTGWGNGN